MAKTLAHGKPICKPTKGYSISLVDAVIDALWKKHGSAAWPGKNFDDLCADASKTLGRQIVPAGIRGTLYSHKKLFERVEPKKGRIRWQLTGNGRALRA